MGDEAKTELLANGYQQDLGNGWVQIEWGDETDAVRDTYMFNRALQEARGAKDVLPICGFNHLEQLAKKFEDHRHRVEKDALFRYSWFLA